MFTTKYYAQQAQQVRSGALLVAELSNHTYCGADGDCPAPFIVRRSKFKPQNGMDLAVSVRPDGPFPREEIGGRVFIVLHDRHLNKSVGLME